MLAQSVDDFVADDEGFAELDTSKVLKLCLENSAGFWTKLHVLNFSYRSSGPRALQRKPSSEFSQKLNFASVVYDLSINVCSAKVTLGIGLYTND